jgi:class 3 adenylate cyclase
MFCDLVGSTSLAARLDAEDWRNLVGAYLDEASAAVTGLGDAQKQLNRVLGFPGILCLRDSRLQHQRLHRVDD